MKSWWPSLIVTLAAAAPAAGQSNPVVIIDTSLGLIKVELFADKSPGTVKNFLQYVDERFYDGTIIHRVIPHALIQGGGHLPDLKEKKTRQPIQDESGNGLRHVRGTIA